MWSVLYIGSGSVAIQGFGAALGSTQQRVPPGSKQEKCAKQMVPSIGCSLWLGLAYFWFFGLHRALFVLLSVAYFMLLFRWANPFRFLSLCLPGAWPRTESPVLVSRKETR